MPVRHFFTQLPCTGWACAGAQHRRFVREDGIPTPFDSRPHPAGLKRLLANTPVIQSACELDLLAFLHRHPRTLLTSEQLAGFVGYNLKDIAQALDAFIEARLLERTAPQSMRAARMFLLLLDGPQGEPLTTLLELASTREGRHAILRALNSQKERPEQLGAAP
ncbi:MAG: hypothetical protein LC776_11950 [Acidobacteria bacterium]|nr:hypothetical protein [Acidobacteriota bacterium]